MAATAYAAAVSLLNTMDTIKIHPFLSTYFNKYSIESLREKVDFFVDFVGKHSDAESEEAEDLLRRIADVAHEAEELINIKAADRIRDGSTRRRYRMTRKLKKITREMDCVKEKAMNAKGKPGFITQHEEWVRQALKEMPPYVMDWMRQGADIALKAVPRKLQRKINRHHTSSVPSSSSAPPAAAMVGFDGYVDQLLDLLTGHHSERQILPIVGMGGIGKTTLATHVFHNLHMQHHFDIRAWITVSQKFSARNMILQALCCLGRFTSSIDTSKSDHELGEELREKLYNRRYLIILDDIWSTVEAWESIMSFFPENNNRSRIVVTTRLQEVVDYFGSSAVAVDFLNQKHSWELFCEKTFAKESCPRELEEIGKEIVEKCNGLPLAITVFGGLLRKTPRTREDWEIIAKDKCLIMDSGDENIKPLSILYLSYKHLPVKLKPCFLYLGLYPENHEIDVSKLIKLWVAEGFIRSKAGQSLEEAAESYRKELVDRNLLLVGELRLTTNKKLRSCRVHDVVRDLCIRIVEKEKYYCVQRDINEMRHLIVDEATAKLFYPQKHQETVPSLFSPLMFHGKIVAPYKSRLLRVSVYDNLHYSSQQVNLRFILNDGNFMSPSISLFWSMQTLILHSFESIYAPREIWKMPQLRHIEILDWISLPDPHIPTCEDDVIVLHNLQTFKRVKNLVLKEEVCKRIPNIKELEISYMFNEASSCYHLHNLSCFNKLELLELCDLEGSDLLQNVILPSSLKELRLSGWKLMGSDMAMVASLPDLQFLKLGTKVVVGPTWDCVEGGFPCLKHLYIHNCDDMISWNADSSSFPKLETLSLEGLYKLEEIPSDIRYIPTLERMDVQQCSESVIMSAIEILKEQVSDEDESLQLTLNFYIKEDAEKWRREIKEMGIKLQNLHIDCLW